MRRATHIYHNGVIVTMDSRCSGAVLGEEQRIDRVSALHSVTAWAAYQYGEERIKGSLEPGKLADMTVLAENPLTVDPERIKDIEIVATVVGNRVVHGTL